MFTRPSLTFLLGPLFSKKSWLALDLGVSTAAGHRWPETLSAQAPFPFSRGRDGDGVGLPVLYIDEIHGFPETSRRLANIIRYRHVSRDLPFHFTSTPGGDLTSSTDLAALTQQARSYTPGIIVIDHFGRLDVGPGTSSTSRHLDVGPGTSFHPLVSSLLALAHSTNAAVLLLLETHTRSQRSKLAATLTALGAHHVLGLDFYPTDLPKATPYNKLLPRYRSGYIHLSTLASLKSERVFIQAKIHASDRSYSLTAVDRIPNLQTLRLSTFQTVLGPAGFHILSLLQAKGSASSHQLIAATTSASRGRVVNLIKELSKSGFISRTQPGGKGVPTSYTLSPAGLSLIQEQP